jgi:hypothetical protein
MYKEKRTIFLVILTLFFYATTLYFEYDSFIFPFPIFDFIIILLAIQFVIWNIDDIIKFRKWYVVVYFSALIIKLLINPVFWSIFLEEIALEQFIRGDSLNFLKISYVISNMTVFILWSYAEKYEKRIFWCSVLILLQIFGLFEFSFIFSYFTFSVFAIYIFLQKRSNSLGYLILLHGILDLISFFMVLEVH